MAMKDTYLVDPQLVTKGETNKIEVYRATRAMAESD